LHRESCAVAVSQAHPDAKLGHPAGLRTTYPSFDLTSASVDYKELTTLTTTQQKAEACNSEATIVSHEVGHRSPCLRIRTSRARS
jgi:hypothetical protein